MTIQEYLTKHSLSQAQFADRIGRTQGAISQWILGVSRISAENAVLIERRTSGEITAAELRPDVFGDAA